MIVFIYNNDTNKIEKYIRNLLDPMPYAKRLYLTVRDFRGSSKGNILWTDKLTMQTFTQFREYYNKPIHVKYAFKRIWEGGHVGQSQHYAGTAFDAGQNLTEKGRNALYSSANSFGKWTYVQQQSETPDWVHFDKGQTPGACKSGGYIMVKHGSRGNYVFVLQDALNSLGYFTGGLDGIFGNHTQSAVREFQRENQLAIDGIAGCDTWTALAGKANGAGQTPMVVV